MWVHDVERENFNYQKHKWGKPGKLKSRNAFSDILEQCAVKYLGIGWIYWVSANSFSCFDMLSLRDIVKYSFKTHNSWNIKNLYGQSLVINGVQCDRHACLEQHWTDIQIPSSRYGECRDKLRTWDPDPYLDFNFNFNLFSIHVCYIISNRTSPFI
jgi:hypothetical protein